MNNLMVFENKEVEVFEFKGKVLFNSKHVAACLDIKNVNDNLRKMNDKQVIKLTNSDIGDADIRNLNNRGENFLTESGVYKLIFKSKKEEAEKFQDWVTDEVLPNVRKTGGYIPIDDGMSDNEIMAKALQISQRTIEERNLRIKELEPKAKYTDIVLNSPSLFSVTQIASDYGMTAYKFNQLLHKLKLQYKQGEQWLLYSIYKDKGYVFSETTIISKNLGLTKTRMTTKWTQKGRKFLYDLLKVHGIVPIIERKILA